MSRLIRVSDELHARIEAMANRSYRSLAGQIEFMVDAIGSDTPKEITQLENNIPYQKITVTPLNQEPDLGPLFQKPAPKKIEAAPNLRTPREILDKIHEYESMIESEKEYNQDADSRDKNIVLWQAAISNLWSEYHNLKES